MEPVAANRASTRPSATVHRHVHHAVASATVRGMLTDRWGVMVLVLAMGAQLVLSFWLVGLHRAYNSNAFDLGFFDQIIWNSSQGRFFQTSFVNYNFAGQHLEPVLLLAAAAYRLGGSIELVLAVQSAAVAWAALPLYLAARRVMLSGAAAVCVTIAYLIAPHLHGAALFDFHPELFGPLLLFSAYALLVSGRPTWAVVTALSTMLLKEDAALAGVGFAVVLWCAGKRRHALTLAAICVIYLGLVVGVVMPRIRSGPSDLQERYGYLGTEAPAIVAAAIRNPDVVLRHLTTNPSRDGLLYIVGAQAGLPLLSPAGLAAVPTLALNALVTHPPQRGLTLHYAILPFALLTIASVQGAATLAGSKRLRALWESVRLREHRPAVALAMLLVLTQGIGWAWGSPLGPRRIDIRRVRATDHAAAVGRVLRLIPSDAPVSAQSGLLPHLSRRREVWEFPRLEGATWVVVDTKSWRSSQSNTGYARVLAELPARGFCRVLTDDGVTLYRRGEPCVSPS